MVLHRLVVLPYALKLLGQTEEMMMGDERFVAFSSDIFQKLQLFISLTTKTLDLWQVGGGPAIGVLVGILATVLLSVRFILDVHSRKNAPGWTFAIERLAVVLALLVLANAPILLAQGNSTFYRHLVAYQWLVVFLIVLTARGIALELGARRTEYALTGGVLACAVLAGLYSHWNLSRNVVAPNAAEFRYLTKRLFESRDRLPTDIVVIQPDVKNLGAYEEYSGLGDEFGKITTMYWQDTPWIIQAALKELALPRESVRSVKVVQPAANLQLPSDVLVIDMREFVRQYLPQR
jgi:hypothetical protein